MRLLTTWKKRCKVNYLTVLHVPCSISDSRSLYLPSFFLSFLFFLFPFLFSEGGWGPLTTLYSSYSSHLLEVVVFFKGSWKFHQIHFMIIFIKCRDIWVTFKGRQQVSLIRHNSLSFFFIKDVSHERLKEYKVTYTNLYRWSMFGVRGSGAIVLLPAVRFRIYTISDV